MRRSRLLTIVLMTSALMGGCGFMNKLGAQCAYAKCNPFQSDAPSVAPGVTLVAPEELPPELADWKQAQSGNFGAVSAVVGDSLYVAATPGSAGSADKFFITDLQIIEKRVVAYGHLQEGRGSTHAVPHPLVFAKVPYDGAQELPVELKVTYDSAAFAHVPTKFDYVDPTHLPGSMQDWLEGEKPEGAEARILGDYLYVMVSAGERVKAGDVFYWMDLSADESRVQAKVHVGPDPHGAPAPATAPTVIFARIPFQGDTAPHVEVNFTQQRPNT